MAHKSGKKACGCLSLERSSSSPMNNNRPKKLRQWNDDAMKCAYDMVTDGKIRVNRAALVFNVPCTMLKDRVSGRVIHGSNMGLKMYLTTEKEKELVEFFVELSKKWDTQN